MWLLQIFMGFSIDLASYFVFLSSWEDPRKDRELIRI